jgi:hypothetical protein
MLKCSFCGAANEDGAHFCDKCKTDLTVAEPQPAFAAATAVTDEPPVTETVRLSRIPMVESLGPIAGDAVEGFRPPAAGAPTVAAEPTLEEAPTEVKFRLVVQRGEKVGMEYPLYPGKNYLGRTDEKPVDIDLENQEPADRIWTSRQHAVITFENGALTIEDLNSLNGTFVNRTRVHPGQLRTLQANDIIQCGTVHMRVLAG